MASRPPARALIYHFTHIGNVPAVLRARCLSADSDATAAGLTIDVGDTEIKQARRTRRVPVAPGGVVADYVPFYFAPRSPMMYRIACDHRDDVPDRYPDGDDPLVYLVSAIDQLTDETTWLATDGNAAVAVTQFSSRVDELAELVDWPLMTQRDWYATEEDPDRMRRRMAELLVHRQFGLRSLLGFAVRSVARERELRGLLTAAGRDDYISVRPDWYYGFHARGGGEK